MFSTQLFIFPTWIFILSSVAIVCYLILMMFASYFGYFLCKKGKLLGVALTSIVLPPIGAVIGTSLFIIAHMNFFKHNESYRRNIVKITTPRRQKMFLNTSPPLRKLLKITNKSRRQPLKMTSPTRRKPLKITSVSGCKTLETTSPTRRKQ